MKRSDITVVIPAYNAEQYIKKCLDSVFIQNSKLTYNVICVDNASTDSTYDILEKSIRGNVLTIDYFLPPSLDPEDDGEYGTMKISLEESEEGKIISFETNLDEKYYEATYEDLLYYDFYDY